jgi:hypothetical protein
MVRREHSSLGKRFERVRVADNPPTVGQRYLLDNARRNSAVGEDIRRLWRSDAERAQLPSDGFWLFDSTPAAGVLRPLRGPDAPELDEDETGWA